MEQLGIPATLMRGGTSKALFVQAKDLPTTELEQLDKWIRAVFGSPDRRQIDGVGGGDLLTSKLAIIAPSTRPDADIDYTFAQVGVDVPTIVRNLNCGNISAAVAPFVIDAGLVLATDPLTKVRIHNTNTGTIIYSEVPTRNGKACTQGELSISGVPGTGAEIRLDFRNTVGSGTGVLLPTGNVRDTLNVDGIGAIEVSVVDVANLLAFAPATAFELTGTEDPTALEANHDLMARIERVRGAIATKLGLASSPETARQEAPLTPPLVLVSSAADWVDFATGGAHFQEECDLTARIYVFGKIHKAYSATGSICTGVAAALPGSVVNELISAAALQVGQIRIGHPCGTIDVQVQVERAMNHEFIVSEAVLLRTARRLFDGVVYAPYARLL